MQNLNRIDYVMALYSKINAPRARTAGEILLFDMAA